VATIPRDVLKISTEKWGGVSKSFYEQRRSYPRRESDNAELGDVNGGEQA